MFQVDNLTVRYDGKPVFENASFLINKQDRIGLVGKNGAGKTTLLRILSGEQKPDEGGVTMPRSSKIGYLPQELNTNSEKTVINETRTAFGDILQLERELEDLKNQLDTREDHASESYMDLVQQFNDKEEELRLGGGYDLESQLERVLKGLGFNPEDMERPMTEFSGGWQMRVELAKILLSKPDLLLLDEPTNHLDIESIRWLETFLQTFEGALIMVSHDRRFLDNVTNRTLEIVLGKVEDYKTHFSKYIELREAKKEQQKAAQKEQERKKAQMERNIERFRAKPNKAKFAKKLMRELEEMEDIEVEQDDTAQANIQFRASRREGKVVSKGEHLSKAYGDKTIIDSLNYEIQRGDKLAFVGKNGMGKSTLAKIITGEIKDYQGYLEEGHNIDLGYFAQDQPQKLDPEKTIMGVMEASASLEMRPKIRQILGAFLFSGEDVHKKVKVLSGGEKSRLALAEMILHPVNFLVLDEPTNHLDMMSKEVLKNALLDFNGTLVVVSHDRSFMEDLTNKVFEFREDGIQVYPGDINTFLQHRDLEDFTDLEEEKNKNANGQKTEQKAADPKPKQPSQKQEAKPKEEPELSNKERHKQKKDLESSMRKVKNKVTKHEKTIAQLENELAEQEAKLNNPEAYGIDLNDQSHYEEYDNRKKALEEAMEQWEVDYEELKELEQTYQSLT